MQRRVNRRDDGQPARSQGIKQAVTGALAWHWEPIEIEDVHRADQIAMTRLSIKALSPELTFGSIVTGLAPEHLEDPHVRSTLQELWSDRGLIVFRGIEGPEAQIVLSGVFGDLKRHNIPSVISDQQYPELLDVNYEPGIGGTVEIDGEALGAWLPWHFDDSYHDALNRGGILRPVLLPERGGETGFIDRAAAWDRLPQRLKMRVQDLHVIYRIELDPKKQRFGRHPTMRVLTEADYTAEIMKNMAGKPRAVHPLVYIKPDDGRTVLNLSPWYAEEIEGFEATESAALLHELSEHIQTCSSPYFHPWKPDDMVAWDNWRLLHCAAGVPAQMPRRMHRTTIVGDYRGGRFENGERPEVV